MWRGYPTNVAWVGFNRPSIGLVEFDLIAGGIGDEDLTPSAGEVPRMAEFGIVRAEVRGPSLEIGHPEREVLERMLGSAWIDKQMHLLRSGLQPHARDPEIGSAGHDLKAHDVDVESFGIDEIVHVQRHVVNAI